MAMNEFTLRTSIRTLLIGAAAMTASVGWAQQPQPTQTEPSVTEGPAATDSAAPNAPRATTPSGATTIDEAKMDQFADAYVEVQKIQANAADELNSAAADPEKQQQAQAKVENEMIAAVERTGLNLDEFNGIVQTMSADANLRAKVVEKIRKRMGS